MEQVTLLVVDPSVWLVTRLWHPGPSPWAWSLPVPRTGTAETALRPLVANCTPTVYIPHLSPAPWFTVTRLEIDLVVQENQLKSLEN